MNYCPAPDPTSVSYLTGDFLAGGGADLQDICPTVPLCHGADPLTIDYLREVLTNWELTDLGNSAAAAIGVLVIMLGAMLMPMIWTGRAAFWVLKGVFLGLNSVAARIGRILISPFILPCRLALWVWNSILSLLYRLEPMFAYFGCAIIIGTLSGAIIAMISRVITDICDLLLPSRRRTLPRQLTHGTYQPQRTRTPSHPPHLQAHPPTKPQPQHQPADDDEPTDDPRTRAERLDEIRAQLLRNPPRRGGPVGHSPRGRDRRTDDSGVSTPEGGPETNRGSRRPSGGAAEGNRGRGRSSRGWRSRRSSRGNGRRQGVASPTTMTGVEGQQQAGGESSSG
ncbi:hypothetical protein C8A05DRAFT_30753 [Staphylotrichum tortipilum]|uniref:Transmembrane protein n=1 Tax=Staphylotrichum tortipilum TaxID=2831512 RepID=A0AAN6MS50_9PEZI|nr:hypothetical protein C8A05DRAFT_30753 [Staphylotrichum longicolle]